MNNLTYHNIKPLAQQRWLWLVVFSVWLFMINVAIAHAEQHELSKNINGDYQCQLCLTNFNHTPFVLANNLSIIPSVQTNHVIAQATYHIYSIHKLPVCNRGPPCY